LWGIIALVAMAHETAHGAALAGLIPESAVLGPRVLLIAALDAAILWRAVNLARRHRSRGMALVASGIAPLVLINSLRVLAIASGSAQMGPNPDSAVFATMAMVLTFAAVTYNFGFLAYSLEKAHARSERALEEAARADERAATAQLYSAELQQLIAQRDEMLMTSTRLATVSALGLFNATVVHEISQPLQAQRSVLDGLLLRLEQPNVDPVQAMREGLARAMALNGSAAELIQALRRLIAARQVRLEPVSPHACIRAVQPILVSECKRRGITLSVKLSPEVEQTNVRAEAVLLQRVIMNLVGNSIDALSAITQGEREIRLESLPHEVDGQAGVLLRLEDSGPGFPTDFLTQPASALNTQKVDGSGLGLTLTRLAMNAWQGALVVGASTPESPEPDAGTTRGARVDLMLRVI
jgi:C4-dicarboxylate-specific signal transduction histidine kinase